MHALWQIRFRQGEESASDTLNSIFTRKTKDKLRRISQSKPTVVAVCLMSWIASLLLEHDLDFLGEQLEQMILQLPDGLSSLAARFPSPAEKLGQPGRAEWEPRFGGVVSLLDAERRHGRIVRPDAARSDSI